jgi:hypothetical protein
MERVVEPERKGIECDMELDTGEKASITRPRRDAMRVKRAPSNVLVYAQPLGGFAMIVTLFFVPMITLPVLFIPVLLAEVYLLDWTYSKVGLVRDARSSISKESNEKSPEDEIDQKIARTIPKDQFVK